MTLWTLAHQAPLSMGILQARILEWMTCPPPGDLLNPGIKWSPTLQVDSLPSEPPGKAKNTGVGSLSLFQGIFLTQESNWGLLHCSQTLYQLSYQGTPQYLVTCKCHRLCEFLSPAFEAAKHLGRIRSPKRRHSEALVEGNTNMHIISAYFKNS